MVENFSFDGVVLLVEEGGAKVVNFIVVLEHLGCFYLVVAPYEGILYQLKIKALVLTVFLL